MAVKIPARQIEFGEHDESFVKQLASDIGCYYSKTNPRTYSLNRFKSIIQGKTGAFAWVHKEENNYFWVSTRKIWIEQAMAKAIRRKSRPSCLPRDTNLDDDSVSFDARHNYEKTVNSLKLVNKIRQPA